MHALSTNKNDDATCECSFIVSGDSDEGTVTWKFDLTDSGVVVDSVCMQCSTWLHDTGRVLLKLCTSEMCTLVPGGMIVINSLLHLVITVLVLIVVIETTMNMKTYCGGPLS
jgi:hypothetical protein